MTDEYTCDDGYPTEAALERIAAWRITTRAEIHALVDFVRGLWAYPEYFRVTQEPGKPPMWHMSTAGWSGNESIIEALQRNPLFWMFCWQSSRRGGHHTFQCVGIFPDDVNNS
jgi:hypothetical protein